MAYLTENQLNNVMDLPIALSATDLRMGDWLVVSAIKIVAPMRLTYKLANLIVSASTVDPTDISNSNKVFGNLGIVYLALRKDYISGSPGEAGGFDVLVAYDLGVFTRDTSLSVVLTAPGVYSWIVANNCTPSTDENPVIPTSTSIDFRVAVTGTTRLELDAS